uniref:ecto-ADP-ribosyltransferase 5-like n=1 Tax=Semicossyphus pulcher TaxID=241346 RepID=UPI0037E78651
MKGNIHFLAPLLLLILVQLVASKKINSIFSQGKPDPSIPLGMVKDAVDDMYSDCKAKMSEKVKDKYFKEENKELFKKVWRNAKKCAERNVRHKEKGDEALTKEHLQAICVYTSGNQMFYDQFNRAVRTSREEYGTTFPFHSLHFWLTSAIQVLNPKKQCLTSYRRTNTKFTGQVNQMIRFGYFASSSRSTKLTQFGTKTCFEINTCHGAYLKKYPHLKDHEEEVLIPPYEIFKISKEMKNKHKAKLGDCKVVYVLKSIGTYSNLNCKAAKLDQ